MSLDSRLRTLRTEDEQPDVERALARVSDKARRSLAIRRGSVAFLAAAAVAASAVIVPRVVSDREQPGVVVTAPPSEEPAPTQSPVPPVEPAPTSSPASVPSAWKAKKIVYATDWASGVPKDDEDLWLYDVESGQRKRLTNTGDSSMETLPKFLNEGQVSFVVGGSFHLLDLRTGESQELFSIPNANIVAYDWAVEPDYSPVALIYKNDFSSGQPSPGENFLALYNLGPGGKVHTLRDLGGPCDCDAVDETVPVVEWQPQGQGLLVGMNWASRDRLVYIVDPQGKDLVAPFDAWEPRWSADGHTVYAHKDFTWEDEGGVLGDPKPGSWFAVDVSSGKHRSFAMNQRSYHSAISPDGSQIATVVGGWPYTSPREFDYALHVFDIQTGEDKKIISGYRDPIWLSPTEIAATRVKECPGFECNPNNWRGVAGARIDLRTGKAKSFDVRSTILGQVDVLYE